MINRLAVTFALATAWVALPGAAGVVPASPPFAVTITLKDHQFSPSTITVPAGQPVRVQLINRDGTTEEIDGDALGWDTKVPPHGKVMLPLVAPLKPGTYTFFGELHPKTAQGTLTVTVPTQP